LGWTPATSTRADPPVGRIKMERVFVQRPSKGQLPAFYAGKAPLHTRAEPCLGAVNHAQLGLRWECRLTTR